MKLILLLVCLIFFPVLSIFGQVPPDFVCTNEPNVNMAIFDGLKDWVTGTSYSGGNEVQPADETTRGAIIIVNKNDTDGDGVEDRDDIEVVSVGAIGRNEIDLAKLIIERPPGMNVGETVIITVNNFANVRFYLHPTKLIEEVDLHAVGTITYQFADLPKILYIEAISPSAAQGDINITMDFNGTFDIVNLTAVTVDFRRSWMTNATCDCPENIDPTALIGPQDENLIVNTILTVESFDGSRYGFGHYYEDPINPGTDKYLGGRVLFEFEVIPGGIDYNAIFGLIFDVTRQIEVNNWRFSGNSDEPIAFCLGTPPPLGCVAGVELFPYNNGSDNELPNDDITSNDEHNTPPLLYSFDAPGISGLGASRFGIIQDNFHEYVRVSLSPTAWGENLIGSRISEKINWHMFESVKAGLTSVEIDLMPASNSGPIRFTPFGWNGTGIVNILANPINRSYWALFDLATDTWQLTNGTRTVNIGGSIAWVNIAIPPEVIKQWTLEDPMSARLIITQDTSVPPLPFEANNLFSFTIFNSGNKTNQIALGLRVAGF